MAGHMELDNLILIYDNNGVTCDGPISLTISDDINGKMRYVRFQAQQGSVVM